MIFYSGDEFLGWDQNLLVTSLKYKLLVKLEMRKGKVVKKQIIFKDKIGRLRDIEVNSNGEIYLITDEKQSYIWRLTSAQNNR
jgi:quinoprotein glucose dehydrogenase